MGGSSFDEFAEDYQEQHAKNLAWAGASPDYFSAYKIADLAEWMEQEGCNPKRILDFGTGVGNALPYLLHHFPDAQIIAADESQRCLEAVRTRFPAVKLSPVARNRIDEDSASIDVVLAANVFHHVPPVHRHEVLRELYRVLRPGGRLAVFEHNPLNPLTRKCVRECPFDRDAELIECRRFRVLLGPFNFASVQSGYRVFVPEPMRRLRGLERFLLWCPMGAQYRIWATKASTATARCRVAATATR